MSAVLPQWMNSKRSYWPPEWDGDFNHGFDVGLLRLDRKAPLPKPQIDNMNSVWHHRVLSRENSPDLMPKLEIYETLNVFSAKLSSQLRSLKCHPYDCILREKTVKLYMCNKTGPHIVYSFVSFP